MKKKEQNKKQDQTKIRLDHELPEDTLKLGWRYHHLGIPTDLPKPGEKYLKELKMYVSGFDKSPYGIEWMRFEPDSTVSDLVKTVPHLAFEVDNLEAALEDREIIGEICTPSDEVRVAMFVDDGALIEVLEFSKKQ